MTNHRRRPPRALCLVLLATGLMFSAGSSAQSEYYRHVIFDSSGHLDIYGPRDNYNPSQQ